MALWLDCTEIGRERLRCIPRVIDASTDAASARERERLQST